MAHVSHGVLKWISYVWHFQAVTYSKFLVLGKSKPKTAAEADFFGNVSTVLGGRNLEGQMAKEVLLHFMYIWRDPHNIFIHLLVVDGQWKCELLKLFAYIFLFSVDMIV